MSFFEVIGGKLLGNHFEGLNFLFLSFKNILLVLIRFQKMIALFLIVFLKIIIIINDFLYSF